MGVYQQPARAPGWKNHVGLLTAREVASRCYRPAREVRSSKSWTGSGRTQRNVGPISKGGKANVSIQHVVHK